MTKKLTHTEADYRVSKSETERCGRCSMFVSSKPPSCTAVEKPIKSFDVCKLFEPKK